MSTLALRRNIIFCRNSCFVTTRLSLTKCFNCHFKEGQSEKLELPEDRVDFFEMLLEFIYIGRYRLPPMPRSYHWVRNHAFSAQGRMPRFHDIHGEVRTWGSERWSAGDLETHLRAFIYWWYRYRNNFRAVPVGNPLRILLANGCYLAWISRGQQSLGSKSWKLRVMQQNSSSSYARVSSPGSGTISINGEGEDIGGLRDSSPSWNVSRGVFSRRCFIWWSTSRMHYGSDLEKELPSNSGIQKSFHIWLDSNYGSITSIAWVVSQSPGLEARRDMYFLKLRCIVRLHTRPLPP